MSISFVPNAQPTFPLKELDSALKQRAEALFALQKHMHEFGGVEKRRSLFMFQTQLHPESEMFFAKTPF